MGFQSEKAGGHNGIKLFLKHLLYIQELKSDNSRECTRDVLLLTLVVNSSLYVESTCGNSFKPFLDYFKAEKVKYWLNLPELLTDNVY